MVTKSLLNPITDPFDFLRYNLNDIVFIKLRKERTITGRLHAFDQHMNMIIGDADETLNKIVIDEDTQESTVTVILLIVT